MMQTIDNPTAQKLLEAFVRFRRLHWRQSPVTGLTTSEVMVLHCIKRAATPDSDGIKVSEISSHLNVASPTITQQINSLETGKYVIRKMDKEDRRAVRIKLTKKGEVTLVEASDAFLASIKGLVEYLGDEESEQLARLLSKVYTYFSEAREANP